MKKIVKLTEADLARIVRRVIKEQPNDRFVDNLANNRNQAEFIGQQTGLSHVLKDWAPNRILVEGADKRESKQLLKNFLRLYENTVRAIAFRDCEEIDLSGIDFCQYPNLNSINLRGTPNNFEETQGDCYHIISDGVYDFSE
jgi:hypothetical protein